MVPSLATDLWLTRKDNLQLKAMYCSRAGLVLEPLLHTQCLGMLLWEIHATVSTSAGNGKTERNPRGDKKVEGSWVIFMHIEAIWQSGCCCWSLDNLGSMQNGAEWGRTAKTYAPLWVEKQGNLDKNTHTNNIARTELWGYNLYRACGEYIRLLCWTRMGGKQEAMMMVASLHVRQLMGKTDVSESPIKKILQTSVLDILVSTWWVQIVSV